MLSEGTDSLATIRRLLSALDRLSLDEALEVTDPQVELETPLIELWGLDMNGHRLVREWFRRIGSEWAFLELEEIELEPTGDWAQGRVRARGRGKASPDELEWEMHLAALARRGRLVRIGLYLSRERAIELVESGPP